MGKGVKGSASLGNAILRRASKDKRKKQAPVGTGFHVADLEHSSNPLQSVTQSSSLEEFMAVATMADRDFTAERSHVSFVSDDGHAGDQPRARSFSRTHYPPQSAVRARVCGN